jgi:hypothetical protein
MDQTLGKEYAITQREAFLNDNCDAVVEKGYMKRLSAEEIQESKEQLSETAIQINDLEVEKKEVMKEYKQKLGPLFSERNVLLKNIKEKAIFTREQCYKFVDQDDKMVGFYNGEGDLIESRPATSEELQGTIFQIGRKTGTNN